MECKNCHRTLDPDTNYCLHCGAKVILNRLSLKNIWEDIYEQYLNLDNRLIITMVHLFTKPEEVLIGYLTGLRKRYLNPISYLGLALTLIGIYIFVIKKKFLGKLDFNLMDSGNTEGAQKIFQNILDYQSFTFVLLIPIIAGLAWIFYRRPRYNFTEHLVCITYLLAQFYIVTFPLSLLLLFIDSAHFTLHSYGKLALILFYTIYAYRRITEYRIGKFLLRSFLFMSSYLIGYFIFTILIILALLLTGLVSPDDISPK